MTRRLAPFQRRPGKRERTAEKQEFFGQRGFSSIRVAR